MTAFGAVGCQHTAPKVVQQSPKRHVGCQHTAPKAVQQPHGRPVGCQPTAPKTVQQPPEGGRHCPGHCMSRTVLFLRRTRRKFKKKSWKVRNQLACKSRAAPSHKNRWESSNMLRKTRQLLNLSTSLVVRWLSGP